MVVMSEHAAMTWASSDEQLGMATDWTPGDLTGHQVVVVVVGLVMLLGPWLLRLFKYDFPTASRVLTVLFTLGGWIYLGIAAGDLFHHTPEADLGQAAMPFLIFAALEAISLLALLADSPLKWILALVPNGIFFIVILISWWHEATQQQAATMGAAPSAFVGAMVVIGIILAVSSNRTPGRW